MYVAWGSIIVFLIVIVGILVLQVLLSKRQNKWFGLIIPIISLGLATINGLIIFMNKMGKTISETVVNGEVVERVVEQSPDVASRIGSVCLGLLLLNIPTAILLVIYFACREGIKKKSQIDKMKIQDL